VHIGALGWNGFLTFGMIYWLFPRMFNTKLYSNKLANLHFWMGTLAMLFYSIPMYWAGWTEASMWKQFTASGDLVYPNFLEIVTQIMPMYWMRLFGGTLYFLGMFLLVYNIYKTVKAGEFVPLEAAEAPALEKEGARQAGESYHRIIERRPIQFMILAIVAVLIGGIIEIIPTFIIKSNIPTIATVKPYTPLELQGRDIYIKEGCYVCHSQMVRPFRSETERYGEYSKAGEYVYDHPFQWGSKRIGPDLWREGVKSGPLYKSDAWHYTHFMDPQKVNAQSIMPKYPWLAESEIDVEATPAKIRVMQYLGVPYPAGYDLKANDDLKAQAEAIAAGLKTNGIDVAASKQIIALIAYIQRLGTDVGDSKTALK
jgi:cytochrome c oxidase cbb3-type subunit I/II